jgi:hypothetical protein
MGNGHEPVQGRPANDGVEGEVNFRNFELYVLNAEAVLRPESDRQGDGPYREHGIRANSGERARWSQLGLRDLQVLERCIADDAEACASVDQHVVEADVGDGGCRDERQHTSARHVLRAVRWPEGDGGVLPPLVGRRLRRPRLHREDLSAKGLDVPPGDELRTAAVHDVQLLAALLTAGLGVGLVEETLEVFVGGLIPQLPLRCSRVGIGGFLLAGPPRRGGAFPRGLVAPLAKALRKLLDLAALGGAVASPRMDRARPEVGALLTWALASGVLAPGRRSNNGRTPDPRLVKAMVLLILFLAAARGSDTGFARLCGSCLSCRVPRTAFCSPGVFVRQSEQGGDGFHLMSRQLLQHLLITDPLTESRDDRRIGDTRNSSTYLGEAGDEGLEGFSGLLPYSVKVSLHTMLLVRTGKICRELCAELTPGLDGSRSRVHEPGPGWPGQGYMKVTCHDGIVTSSRRDGGDVDLQEL